MKTTIQVNEVTNKDKDGFDLKTQKGQAYWKFQTSEGTISIFNKKIADFLEERMGKSATVDLQESDDGQFKNIRKVYPDDEAVPEKPGEAEAPQEKPKTNGTYRNPDQMIMCEMVGDAKDIFCALTEQKDSVNFNQIDLMKLSIDLVKQAMKEFE